jgi:hypothetical protein
LRLMIRLYRSPANFCRACSMLAPRLARLALDLGDHSDVMSCRQTGFAMLAAASVQETLTSNVTHPPPSRAACRL